MSRPLTLTPPLRAAHSPAAHRPSLLGNAFPSTLPAGYKEREESTSRSRRLTSPERWEIKQLIAAGVLDKADYPDFDEVWRHIQELRILSQDRLTSDPVPYLHAHLGRF